MYSTDSFQMAAPHVGWGREKEKSESERGGGALQIIYVR